MIEKIKKTGLCGRGRAVFLAFVKWSDMRGEQALVKYLVCNDSEGEPETYKDRFLLGKKFLSFA